MEAKEVGVGYRVEWEDVLYLAPTPIVRLNSLNQFHNVSLPAIEWETDKFYYLNGVNFKEELWKKVVSGKMPFEDILKIEDVDQRTQAMRFGDVEKFLEHTKAKKLDEHIKFTPDGTMIHYRLFEIPKEMCSLKTAYYMVYECPSTMKLYMSGVPKAATCAEAMSWKQGVSKETWLAMKPLVHES